ncbi:hypothetical protein Q9L58_004032 [Maublancomyces gigas]|uniref:Ubiquitin 3 binding protein But2 C-terminal domain-containing protein n=1 Tax=Discina gigas TaxID=1032678 RepID=A0ABR3GLX5_9PEZI
MRFTLLTAALALFSVSSSAPVPDATLDTRSVQSFYPTLAVNIFTPDKGTVKGDVYVFRTTQVGIQHETNSLLSIPFPDGHAGKTCSFAFAGGWAPPRTNWAPPGADPNSQRVQLFTVGGTISATNTYTSRPYRDVSYGIFKVSNDGATGTWDGPTPTFPCPAKATVLGFEVAPQGDFDDVSWPLHAGLAVIVK